MGLFRHIEPCSAVRAEGYFLSLDFFSAFVTDHIFLPKKGFPLTGKPLIISLSGLPFLGQNVEYHSGQQNKAFDYPLVVRIQVDLEHSQVDHADQGCAATQAEIAAISKCLPASAFAAVKREITVMAEIDVRSAMFR